MLKDFVKAIEPEEEELRKELKEANLAVHVMMFRHDVHGLHSLGGKL